MTGSTDRQRLTRSRIRAVLRKRHVASIRTLEAKIVEAGPNFIRVPPHEITAGIKALMNFKDIFVVAAPKSDLPKFQGAVENSQKIYALTDTDPGDVEAALQRTMSAYASYNLVTQRKGEDGPGRLAERLIAEAVKTSGAFFIASNWGNVTEFDGIKLVGALDGVIIAKGVAAEHGIALVEIKNGREWIYADTVEPWDLIRNAFLINAVPVLFARRIYGSTFTFVFRRVGGLGIETRKHFMPAATATLLADARHVDGLGFYDIDFSEKAPTQLINRIRRLVELLPAAHARMQLVRPIVEPFLDELGNVSASSAKRSARYYELQALLDEFDSGLRSLILQ